MCSVVSPTRLCYGSQGMTIALTLEAHIAEFEARVRGMQRPQE